MEENILVVHQLLLSGIIDFSVHIPLTLGGSDILHIKYDWSLAMMNRANLYCTKIADSILFKDSPVVIVYNCELNTAGYKADVNDIPQCTNVLQLLEKVDSSI